MTVSGQPLTFSIKSEILQKYSVVTSQNFANWFVIAPPLSDHHNKAQPLYISSLHLPSFTVFIILYSAFEKPSLSRNVVFGSETQSVRTEKTHDQRKNNLLSLFIKCPPVAERKNKRVVFNLRTGKTVEEVEPLYTLDDRLTENDGFFKCHRSYLVYLPNVGHFSMTEIITKSGRRAYAMSRKNWTATAGFRWTTVSLYCRSYYRSQVIVCQESDLS